MSRVRTIKRMYERDLKRMIDFHGRSILQIIRPKPKWLPRFVWFRIVTLIIPGLDKFKDDL